MALRGSVLLHGAGEMVANEVVSGSTT